MKKIDTGGPASNKTLRDYFASQSNFGVKDLVALYKAIGKKEGGCIKEICDDLAQVQFIYADAMIEARRG